MRNTHRFRWLVAISLLIVLSIALAACGTDDDEGDDEPTVEPTPVAAVSEEDEGETPDDAAVEHEGEAEEEIEDTGNQLEDAGEDLQDAAEEAGDAVEDAVEDVEAPDVEAPDVEAPDVDLPDVEAPDVEAPDVEAPDVDLPDVEAPDVEAPDVEAPDVEAPDVDLPDVDVDPGDVDTDVELPEVDPGDIDADVDLPEVDPGDTDVDVELPDVDVDVDTEPGNVDVDSEAPEVEEPGDVDVDVDAPEVEEPGDVDVDVDAPSADLPDVDVESGDVDADVELPEADVELPEVDVDVDTEPGDVEIEDEGELDVDVDPGDIEVDDSDVGDDADVDTDADLDLDMPEDDEPWAVAKDQFIADGRLTIERVTIDEPGWLVIHADDDGSPGAVLGYTQIEEGASEDVMIELKDGSETTDRLWLMLHEDTGEVGVYEFGDVEDADLPATIDGEVALVDFWTVPKIRARPQILMHGDNMPEGDDMVAETATMTIKSVLSDGPGWLVVHAAEGDSFGSVIGYAPVQDGRNENVEVELEQDALTPSVWPMLHEDTGEVGTYEFGEVEDADAPVMRDGEPLTFSVPVAPALSATAVWIDEATLSLNWALIDQPGWLVIHRDNGEGAPGAVLGYVPLQNGLNRSPVVELDADSVTETVFPMLHYDTGEEEVYEFGEVEGADVPVMLDGSPVVRAVDPLESEEVSEQNDENDD